MFVAVIIPSFDTERIDAEPLYGSVSATRCADPTGVDWTFPKHGRTGKALWFDNDREPNRKPRLPTLLMVHDLAPWIAATAGSSRRPIGG